MPGSVKLALLAVVLLIACLIGVMAVVFRMGGIAITEPIGCAIALLVFFGLYRRHRLAYVWGRRIGLFGAVLNGIVAVGHVVAATADSISTSQTAEALEAARFFSESHFAMAGFCFAAAAAQLLLFASLGFASAAVYFGLACPRCQCDEVHAGDFAFTEARCGACGAVWR